MIYTNQLPESPPSYVVLYCSGCGSQYSATKGDYFLHDPTEPLRCECDFQFPLAIVTRRTIYDHDRGQRWLQ